MIDVLHLIDTYRVGGPGKTILNSARFIDPARFRLHVGSFVPPDPALHEFATAVRTLRIPYLHLQDTRRAWPVRIRQVREYVRQHGIRILHTHGYRTDFIGYAATVGLQVARVTTHHGWIRNSGRQELKARLALQLCRRMDAVELVSESLRNELPAGVARSSRVEVVHNAIVLEDYTPRNRGHEIRARLGVADEVALVGVVGRLSPEKGCLEMVDAFAEVAARQPNACLVFVGEGPMECHVREKVRGLRLDDRVRIAGYQAEVQAFYEAFDVFVSPSRTEGLSNAILEAMAFRLPIVATRVGGNMEILEDGLTALLVEPCRPAELADALCRLLSDRQLRCRLMDAARHQVETAFGFTDRMRKEEQLYLRALRRHSHSRLHAATV